MVSSKVPDMDSILPLKLSNATVVKRGAHLIGPIDLTIEQGGITIIVGPNGSGKTTLLRLMHGLERPKQGCVEWAHPSQAQIKARQGFVFQSPIVLRRTVRENLAYPLVIRGEAKKNARAQSDEWLTKIGLSIAAERSAAVLSGGEKQKLALARALITAPEVLFLDEPTTNLDGAATQDIENLLLDAVHSNTRIIMTTHDFGQARRLASDVIFIYHGLVHERTRADEFFNGPATPEAGKFLTGDILL
jgi:tungstate transport system ATP-binding protein